MGSWTLSPWDKLTGFFGGKSHFLLVTGLVLVTVAFFLKGESPAFVPYVGFISLACGLQHRRSIKEDEIGNTNLDPGQPRA
jgi:hypothetical protein